MRSVDMPIVEVSTDIEAPPSLVWDLVTDVSIPARFSDELWKAEWIGTDAPRAGARFRGHNQHPVIGTWSTTNYVVVFEPTTAFAWAVTDPDHPSSSWGFRIDRLSKGCRLTQWGQVGPGPSGLTAAIARRPDQKEAIVARRLDEWRNNMTKTIDGIRDLAEGR